MFLLRKLFNKVEVFHLFLVISCTYVCIASCGPCSTDSMHESTEYVACESYVDDLGVSGYTAESPTKHMTVESICTNSHPFCFPSTLPGFSKEHEVKSAAFEAAMGQSDGQLDAGSNQGGKWAGNESWLSHYGIFELPNGQTVSCSLNVNEGADESSSTETDSANQNDFCSCKDPLLTQKSNSFRMNVNSEVIRYGSFDVSPSPHVKISPPVLDWGQKHLYFPSVAFLTVVNTCNDSNLHVYEPFSTNIQFYPCNFSEVLLGPGEVASICIVFLPRWLGMSSAHLVIQTSSGGFLVQVRGYAIEPPYEISSLVSPDVPSNGRLNKNLSLFNPFDEAVYVKELSIRILVSQGNISHHTKAACSLEKFWDSDELGLLTVKDWLVLRNGEVGNSLIAMRPGGNWEIGPQSGGNIIEIDFSYESEGRVYGAFCMQLLRASQDASDTVVVPLEADFFGKVAIEGTGSVLVSLEVLISSDASSSVIAISLSNHTPFMLSVISISEFAATEVFQIKYIKGLLLFPGTITQIAIVACTQLPFESPSDIINIEKECKLVILTNDSMSPQIEIHCQEIIRICPGHPKDSFIAYDHRYGVSQSGNQRTRTLKSSLKLPLQFKAFETAEADEFVLENWKWQGTARAMSVLDDHEVVFPMVQVGAHHSKWITVKNPSERPVVMQLILHSGEIIDDCRDTDGFVQPLSSSSLIASGSVTPARYGFSMAEGALTEAFVHPYGKASFGPIFFHPSNRCGWRSSALIRNNLSGVEWLSLRGFGGLLSLVLFEKSEPVQSIEFKIDLPIPLNISPPDIFLHTEKTIYACSQTFSKELYAKNTGDLPVKVKSIEVSGTECGLDGFMVHDCKAFSLEPGESTKLLISYQTDFSAAILHRDLELALAGGVLVVPMKASLPLNMFSICRRSVFWVRLKKFLVAVLLVGSLMFLIFCGVFPHVIALGFEDYNCKSWKSPITTVRNAAKPSRFNRKLKNSKFSVPAEVDGLLRSEEEKTSKQGSETIARYQGNQDGAQQGLASQNGTPTAENHENIMISSYEEKDKTVPSLLSKSVLENSDILEASQLCKLTIRTGKERGRKRRKRRGVGAALTGLFEVSSSQSGNSTPSSPLSPVTSATTSRTWSPSHDVDSIEAKNPFTLAGNRYHGKVQVSEPTSKGIALNCEVSLKYCSNNCFPADQEQPSVSRRTSSKPVLLPSATFPGASSAIPNLRCSSPFAGTSSPIAPHARAPGPKLYSQKTAKVEEKVGDEYTYDIWGNHFSGLHLMGSSENVTASKTLASENNSNSFFVRGPQALVTRSQPESVSCSQQEG